MMNEETIIKLSQQYCNDYTLLSKQENVEIIQKLLTNPGLDKNTKTKVFHMLQSIAHQNPSVSEDLNKLCRNLLFSLPIINNTVYLNLLIHLIAKKFYTEFDSIVAIVLTESKIIHAAKLQENLLNYYISIGYKFFNYENIVRVKDTKIYLLDGMKFTTDERITIYAK